MLQSVASTFVRQDSLIRIFERNKRVVNMWVVMKTKTIFLKFRKQW